MASGIQKFNPLGGLDLDNDPNYVKKEDFTAALNVRGLTDNTESTGSIVPMKGNLAAFVVPTTTAAQNKKYKIFHNAVAATARVVTMYRTDGTSFATFSYVDGATLAITASNFSAAVTAALAAASPAQAATLTIGPSSAYTTFELTTVTGYEYSLASTGANEVTVQCIQEAWDTSLTGAANIISSYDLFGDLFVLSTPSVSLPSEVSFAGATAASSGGLIEVTTLAGHALVSGYSYRIMNNIGTVPTFGVWIINATGAFTFTLRNSVFSGVSSATDITVINNYQSIGEVGVATYNYDSAAWTYTTLLKSKEFNFRRQYQIDMAAELNSSRKSIYWTDDYNPPRAFYYKGDYVSNGAIEAINSDGQYAYDTIAEETQFFVFDTSANLSVTGQLQSGGNLTSGNWRYTFRFLTESLVGTDVAELTNPISVFLPSTTASSASIFGSVADTLTGKINQLELTGIIPGLFKYVELVGVNYVDTAIIGYTLSRTQLATNQTSIKLTHTGFETGVTDFDLGTLSVNSARYKTAKNIRILDSRMILSNLTSRAIEDLSEWASAFEHELLSSSITGVREVTTGTFQIGEYLEPMNVYEKVGYTDNEVYRFGVRGKYRDTGELSPVFWVDDIRFDTSSTNITSPDRRIAGLSNFNLTPTGTASTVYVRYVNFSNIDLNYLVDGTPVKEIFSEIIFERAPLVAEVLACGCAAMTMTNGSGAAGYPGSYYGEFPHISGTLATAPAANTLYTTLVGDANREIAKLYCPDIFCDGNSISFLPGDKVYNYGAPESQSPNPANIWRSSGGPPAFYSSAIEYNGYIAGVSPTVIDLDDSLFVDSNTTSVSFGGVSYSQVLEAVSGGTYQFANQSGLLMYSTDTFTNVSGSADYGLYYMQYYREITYTDPDNNKYGDRGLSTYVPTGARYEIDSSSPSSVDVDVFGGDTFTSKFYVKHRAPYVALTGAGGGLGFYAQTKVNHQMIDRTNNIPVGTWGFPAIDIILWLEDISYLAEDPEYNEGYTINDDAQIFAAFDSSADSLTDFPNRIIWSDIKVQNSSVDGYRNYLPLNLKDLDLSFGEIVHHDVVNGELVTWQPRKLQRQYFNTRGQLDTTGLGILIGDGSVLSRDGQTMSALGTYHKWSVIKGKSAQGNDTFYWVNTEIKKVVRLGYDGTVSLGDIKGLQSFFANNVTWVIGKDTPANGEGICGFWDDRYAEAGWTFNGVRDVAEWNALSSYFIGDSVSYLGEIYVSLLNGPGELAPNVNPNWRLIEHNNGDYYSEFTIIYNEYRDRFMSFVSAKPFIYLKWKDTYLSPDYPEFTTGDVYQHNIGNYCSWYNGRIEEDGYIEGVINDSPDEVKWYSALRVQSEIVPEYFDFTTQSQISFLTDAEFETFERYHQSPIKEDSTSNDLNDGDTSLLYGNWLKARMTFAIGTYQKLYNFIIKFRFSSRFSNK